MRGAMKRWTAGHAADLLQAARGCMDPRFEDADAESLFIDCLEDLILDLRRKSKDQPEPAERFTLFPSERR